MDRRGQELFSDHRPRSRHQVASAETPGKQPLEDGTAVRDAARCISGGITMGLGGPLVGPRPQRSRRKSIPGPPRSEAEGDSQCDQVNLSRHHEHEIRTPDERACRDGPGHGGRRDYRPSRERLGVPYRADNRGEVLEILKGASSQISKIEAGKLESNWWVRYREIERGRPLRTIQRAEYADKGRRLDIRTRNRGKDSGRYMGRIPCGCGKILTNMTQRVTFTEKGQRNQSVSASYAGWWYVVRLAVAAREVSASPAEKTQAASVHEVFDKLDRSKTRRFGRRQGERPDWAWRSAMIGDNSPKDGRCVTCDQRESESAQGPVLTSNSSCRRFGDRRTSAGDGPPGATG